MRFLVYFFDREKQGIVHKAETFEEADIDSKLLGDVRQHVRGKFQELLDFLESDVIKVFQDLATCFRLVFELLITHILKHLTVD